MTDIENSPAHLNSLPSDFSDVQPKTYDPHFISHISSKMQVPHRIGAVEDNEDRQPEWDRANFTAEMAAVRMQVPDMISLHDNSPRGRGHLDKLDMGDRGDLPYVGLMTPPRTLTMEEAFKQQAEEEEMEWRQRQSHRVLPNGDTHLMEPFTPGASLSDSILHNDEDDATQLRTQVAKLSRRMVAIEQENQRRTTREIIFYPLVIGYMVIKAFSWLFWRKN